MDLWILSQSRILCYPISNLFTVLINLNLFYHVILYQSCIIQSQLPLPLNLKQRTKQSKYQINLIQLFLRFYLFIYGNKFFVERNPPIQWPLMSDGKREISMKAREEVDGQSRWPPIKLCKLVKTKVNGRGVKKREGGGVKGLSGELDKGDST